MILFVSNSPFLGGAEHYLLDIISGIKKEFKVKVAIPSGVVETEVKKLGVDVVDISIGSTLGRFRGLNLLNLQNIYRINRLRNLLQSLLKSESEILVHTQDYKEMVLFTLAARGLTVKLVYVQHTILPGWLKKNPFVLKFLVKIWNRQDQIIAVSDAVKEELVGFGVEESKVTRIYNGIDINLFKARSVKEKLALKKKYKLEKKLVIGITGRIAWGKGQDVVLLALKDLREKFPNAHALLIGTGSSFRQRKLNKIVEKYALGKSVTFFGNWQREKIPEFYGLLDIFTLPSLSEGLPLSILEAMACETACIGTKIAGIPEEIIDNKTGFLMKERSSAELAKLCTQLLEDENLRIKFGNEGRKVVEKVFTKEIMIKNTLKIYREIISR